VSSASAGLLASVIALGGCATIFSRGPDEVPIATNPPGAYVYVNGQVVGQTPMTVELDRRNDDAQIQVFLPGFQPLVFTRDKRFNMWALANIFIGVFPIVIDLIDGDAQEFDGTPISIGLVPGGPQSQPPVQGAPGSAPPPPQQAPQQPR
jgi:hypothetical protein